MNLISAWQFLLKGGPVMLVIAAVSVVCVALIVERYLALRRRTIFPPALVEAIDSPSKADTLETLRALGKIQQSPLSHLVVAVIERKDLPEKEFNADMDHLGRREAMGLEKNLVYLGILAGLGPLLGLFGTVTGMIAIFHAVQQTGVGSPQELSGGISESLLCTAGGMVIGIPALIYHRYFHHRVEAYVLELEGLIARVAHKVRG